MAGVCDVEDLGVAPIIFADAHRLACTDHL